MNPNVGGKDATMPANVAIPRVTGKQFAEKFPFQKDPCDCY
jgi:hypothetical protein